MVAANEPESVVLDDQLSAPVSSVIRRTVGDATPPQDDWENQPWDAFTTAATSVC